MKPVTFSSLLLCAALLAAPAARADDWGDCRSTNPDKQMAGCTAVLEKRDRPPEDLALAHRMRGSWYARRDMLDRALGDFDKAVELAPASAAPLTDRAAVLRRLGQLDRALADADRAIELDPKNVGGFLQRGHARAQQREWDKALADFEQAVTLRPDNPVAYVSRASALIQTGNLDRAIADLDRAIAMNASNADAFAFRGDAFRKKGDLARTIADFSRAIALNPKNAGFLVARGDAHLARDAFDQAIADFDRALALAPDNRRAQELKRNALAAKSAVAATAGPATPAPDAAVPPGEPGAKATPLRAALARSLELLKQRKLDEGARGGESRGRARSGVGRGAAAARDVAPSQQAARRGDRRPRSGDRARAAQRAVVGVARLDLRHACPA